MMDLLSLATLVLVYTAACLGVIAAAVCRIDEMNRKRNRWSWFAMYVAYAVFALVVLLETLKSGEWNLVYLLGVLALGLNLVVTLPSWARGAPASSCKPGCEP
jgi:predicted membrane channel-forming protein YqfA (hemolysin III family)